MQIAVKVIKNVSYINKYSFASIIFVTLFASNNALAVPYFVPVENFTQAQANYVLNVARSICKSARLGIPEEQAEKDSITYTRRLPYQLELAGWIGGKNAIKAIGEVAKRLDKNCDISKGKFQATLWRMPKYFE